MPFVPDQQQPALRPYDPKRDKPRANADGSFSTEVSRTVHTPTGWANVPSLWWGDNGSVDLGSYSDDQLAEAALSFEQASGRSFPRFRSIAEAESAAKIRSAEGGATYSELASPRKSRFVPDEPAQDTPPAAAPPKPTLMQQLEEIGRGRPVGDLGSTIMEPLAVLGTSAFAAPVAGLAGLGAIGTRALGLTEADPADVVGRVQGALTYEPRTTAGQIASEYSPIALLSKGSARLGDEAGDLTARLTGSPAAGAAVNTAAQVAPALLMKGPKAGKVDANVGRTAPVDRPVAAGAAKTPPAAAVPAKPPARLAKVPDSAPSLEQLRKDKNAAYKRSEEAGVQLSEFSFKKLKGKILNELGERVDPTLHPDTTAALKRVMDTKGAISLEKLDQLRQIANDAKGAVSPRDQRLAAKVVESIDDYLDNISAKDMTRGDPKGAAALKEARDLNTRLKKGEQIEELFRRAEIKAGANFSQSGLENALRQEFKALALDAKKMKRFTPEERAAITKVAKGGKLENALRLIGKLAPVGGMSQGLALIGAAVEPLTMTVTGGALGARAAATRMTVRNANRVSETVRRGRNSLAEEAPAPAKRNALLEY